MYLCASRHEGFCVPIVEAQAAGLPVITSDAAALAGTAGPDQIVVPPPVSPHDFLFYARLVREVCSNADLREALVRQGYRNVMCRFSNEIIENRFMAALVPAPEVTA